MSQIRLPEADGVQDNCLIQWWYWTGHLEGDKGGRYGCEVVFFAVDTFDGALWIQMAQNAITDLGQHFFKGQEVLWPEQPEKLDGKFALTTPDGAIQARGGSGNDTLHSQIAGYTLDLKVKEARPAVLHYDGNRHDYSFGGYTYYYSRELMNAEGTIQRPDGTTERVTGQLWFDRQWGQLIEAVLLGWQWFAIQLDNNTQIMLFDFNNAQEEQYGAITYPDGSTRDLTPQDYQVEVLRWWRSPISNINFPAEWKVHVPDMSLHIVPQLADQEMDAKWWVGPRYWEGACRVTGTHSGTKSITGSAYVELNGFHPWSGPSASTEPTYQRDTGNVPPGVFVNRPDAQAMAQPFALNDASLSVFALRTDQEKVQTILDKFLNHPSGGQTDYRAFGSFAMMYFMDAKVTRSLGAPTDVQGWLPEREVGIWIPAVAARRDGDVNVAQRLVFFPYYMFVDSGHAMATGREVYGFPKEMSAIEMPAAPTDGGTYQMETVVFDTFSPDTEGKRQPLITLTPSGDNVDAQASFGDRTSAIKAFHDWFFEGQHEVTEYGLAFLLNTLDSLLHCQVYFAFLKQFRSIEDANTPCFQAICECPSQVTKFKSAGFLPSLFSLDIAEVASHPIADELGLDLSSMTALPGMFVEMDFQFDVGSVIWQAQGEPTKS